MGAPLKDGANEEAAMTVIGLDLHKRYITACAMTDDGEVLAEQRHVVPEVAALEAFFRGLPEPLTVAMEATLYWAWLHDQLVARGIAVQVAHALVPTVLVGKRPRSAGHAAPFCLATRARGRVK